MNQEFFNKIKPVLIKLEEKIGSDFVIFGSVPLYLIGVLEFDGEFNDLDIAVKDESVIPKEEAKEKIVFMNNLRKKLEHKQKNTAKGQNP